MNAYDQDLRDDNGTVLGTFSSHWAACAAMIRFYDPLFVSTGGDKPEDLEIERHIRAANPSLTDRAYD